MKYPHLAAQLFNSPLMVRPETAEAFASAFVQLLQGSPGATREAAATEERPQTEAFASSFSGERFSNKRFIVTNSGIGILPVYGALAQRAGEIGPDCMEMTSYQRLGRIFDMMVADPDVRGILLEIDSPGGMVAGNFELARRVAATRARKPIYAHANEIAFSGGYSIAAAAEKVFAPDTGLVGSIGVFMLHMSQAEKDAKAGYKYTSIHAGEFKAETNPHFPLSDEARERIQAIVDAQYAIFVSHVAAARGMSEEAVRKTQAAIFEAREGLAAKLIDGVATFAETLAALESRLNGAVQPSAGLAAHQPEKETQMSEHKPAATDTTKPATEASNPAPTQSADAERIAADAVAADRARRTQILALEEAKGRTTLANHLADKTDMSVEQAKAALAASPIEGKRDFTAAMDELKNPKVGADTGAGDEDADTIARRIAGVAPETNPTH